MAVEAGCARIQDHHRHIHFLPARMVAERYCVSLMTLWRWLRSDLGFPKPLYIGKKRYWQESDLVEWENSRRAGARAPQRSGQQ